MGTDDYQSDFDDDWQPSAPVHEMTTDVLLRELAVECWAYDSTKEPLPGRIPMLLDWLADQIKEWQR